MIATALGLVASAPGRRFALMVGAALVVLGLVAWLRHDAALDERARISGERDRATLEALKEKNEIEEEVRHAPDNDLRDLLGIPGGMHP